MKNIYCPLGIILVLSSLFMSYQNIDKKIFTNFNRLLNNDQKQKYQEIIKERINIYITGLLLGLTFGLIYYYSNQKENYIFCKSLIIMIFTHFGFYYFIPKSPLMLYHLTTKEQTDAWADIYSEMKKRWSISIIVGIIGYIMVSYSFKGNGK